MPVRAPHCSPWPCTDGCSRRTPAPASRRDRRSASTQKGRGEHSVNLAPRARFVRCHVAGCCHTCAIGATALEPVLGRLGSIVLDLGSRAWRTFGWSATKELCASVRPHVSNDLQLRRACRAQCHSDVFTNKAPDPSIWLFLSACSGCGLSTMFSQ